MTSVLYVYMLFHIRICTMTLCVCVCVCVCTGVSRWHHGCSSCFGWSPFHAKEWCGVVPETGTIDEKQHHDIFSELSWLQQHTNVCLHMLYDRNCKQSYRKIQQKLRHSNHKWLTIDPSGRSVREEEEKKQRDDKRPRRERDRRKSVWQGRQER